MNRAWTWLGVLALFVGALGLADQLGGPAPATAQGGSKLTQPIPPATAEERVGSIRDRIGWTKAKERWGEAMPLGLQIDVGQVEARFNNSYLADQKNPDLAHVKFSPRSGETKISSHATTVARHIVGPDAAGSGCSVIYSFEAGHWMTAGSLHAGTDDEPVHLPNLRVINHSWIAPDHAQAWRVLRRVDYLIDTQDLTMVVGVDNEPGDVPALLASAYNAISVGNESGRSTDGLTTIETPGRSKPELVAPGGKTSWAAGVVTGCVAALTEVADRKAREHAANANASKSEVIKAVLLAGAYKPDNWKASPGQSLDKKLGAGVVDLDRAIVILEGGAAAVGKQTDKRYAWSFAQLAAGKTNDYRFALDQAQGQSTFALTWHRRVVGPVPAQQAVDDPQAQAWDDRAFIPDLNLSLIRIDHQGNEEVIASSDSTVDNVELIVTPNLKAGQYKLKVDRATDDSLLAWDYALAWRIEAGQ